MREFSATEVYTYLQTANPKPLLLDVREQWEYQICHIDDSTLIPMKSITSKIQDLDPEQDTVVICHHGIRSRMAGRFLEQSGFKRIINLSGGIKSWAEQVDPSMPVY